jgi:hypothetical protein
MDELREAFDAAWDQSEKEATEEREVESNVEGQREDEQLELDAGGGETGTDQPAAAEETGQQQEESTPSEDKAPVIAEKSKAPASWSPQNREAWGKIPSAAQAQITKREQQVNQVLQDSSTARKGMDQLNQVLAPHREGLIAAGVPDPFQMIGSLLATESTMRIGSQQQKAEAAASLIKQYGIDIRTLDSVLTGQQPQQNPNGDLEAIIEQRMAPVNQFLQQQQFAQQQSQLHNEQNAAHSVTEFSNSAEFINDVRMDMADLLDMAAQRGQELSLEDAYKKACAIHPEVSKVLAERDNQARIMGTQNDVAAKRAAASASITGRPAGQAAGNAGMSLRDSIADAWDSQQG